MTGVMLGVVLVLVATLFEGFAHVFFKKATLDAARKAGWIGIGVAFFAVEVLVYTGALQFLDVSTAFPLGSVSFIATTLLSVWLLGETVTPTRWLGVGLILVGAILVAGQA